MTGDACHRLNSSYCGIMAQQTWADFLLWEVVLNEHPEVGKIIELGTGAGGFALFLAHQARARGLAFRTYDCESPECEIPGFVLLDYVRATQRVAREFTRKPVILHSDGGDKIRDFELFSPQLKPGSLIVCHDWDYVFEPADYRFELQPIHDDLRHELGSMSRVFIA